eukprot:1960559-Lingulodinium_polyedra.AAC.1
MALRWHWHRVGMAPAWHWRENWPGFGRRPCRGHWRDSGLEGALVHHCPRRCATKQVNAHGVAGL